MSHPILVTLNDAQRKRLALAGPDALKLARFIAASKQATEPIPAFCWNVGAALAAGLADQLAAVASSADTPASARLWGFAATRLRDTVTRFELWATLDEPLDGDHGAHDAA